jgi:hypothetical protein
VALLLFLVGMFASVYIAQNLAVAFIIIFAIVVVTISVRMSREGRRQHRENLPRKDLR